jgi:hypothetical protein
MTMPDAIASSILIRRATPEDALALRDVAERMWQLSYGHIMRPETITTFVGLMYTRAQVLARINGNIYFVADDDGEIVGFADARIDGGRIFLLGVYAVPDAGEGQIQHRLLEAVRAVAPQLALESDVIDGDAQLEAFYRAEGLVPGPRFPNDYAGETVLEQRWTIGPLTEQQPAA